MLRCRLEEALQSYDAAVAADPNAAATWHARGELLERMGRPTDAVSNFDRWAARECAPAAGRSVACAVLWHGPCLGVDRPCTAWHSLSSIILISLSLPALLLASRACSLEPANPAYLRSRGLAFRSLGSFERAVADFTAVLQLQLDDEAALHARGWVPWMLLAALHSYAQAVTCAARPKQESCPALHHPCAKPRALS